MNAQRTEGGWAKFWLLFLCGVAFGFTFFKVAPATLSLVEYFECSMTEAGLFSSVASLSGTIAALFMAAIQKRIGPKNMVTGALLVSALSAIVALVSPNVPLFIASQFIAGVGFGFLQTGAPTLVNVIFTDPAKRGLPNSIWATWTAVGLLICLNSFTFIIGAFGTWQSVWVFSLVVSIVAALICQFGIRVDRQTMMAAVNTDAAETKGAAKGEKQTLTIYMVMLAVLFALFGYVNACWGSMAPTFMQQAVGLDMGMANFASSITTIVGIGSSIVIGIVLNRVKNQPLVMFACFTLCAIAGCCEFIFTDGALMIPLAIFMGLCLNICPPTLFTNMQWAVNRPQAMGVGFAALAFGAGLGGIPSSVSVGAIVDATGSWAMNAIPLAIAGAVMIVVALLFAIKRGPLAKAGVLEGGELDHGAGEGADLPEHDVQA